MTKYMLKTVNADMAAYGGFVWPESGPVLAPDWDPRPVCGGGLHGLLWGEGDGTLLSFAADAKWLVVEIADDAEVVDLDRKVKINRGTVVFCGDRKGATDRIVALGARGAVVGAFVASGDYGTSTSGNGGTSTSGYRGNSTSGYYGTSTSGDYGTICIWWWNGSRRRLVVGYIGEDGLEANTPYRLDSAGKFVKAEC